MRITQSGVYDIPAAEYHADPCPAPSLSASIAKLLTSRTPRHAWFSHPRLNSKHALDEDEKFDIGKAAHALILGDACCFEVIDAPNWTTKAARERRDEARAAGKIPLLAEQFTRVHAMVVAARWQLNLHADAEAYFKTGTPEQTLIWLEEGGIWCRARLDWLPESGHIFTDYKTTECADPDVFQRLMISLGHDVQAAFYRRGIKALGLCDAPEFRFVVQEREPPHLLSVVAPMPGMLDLAERKVAHAIELFRDCLLRIEWPGYPLEPCYVDAPAWHEAQYMEREHRDNEMLRKIIEGGLVP